MKITTNRIFLLFFWFFLSACVPALSQTADEFDEFGEGDEVTDTEITETEGTDTSAPAIPLGPAEEAIAASNPQTPVELFRATDLLSQMGRSDLAEPYLDKLLSAKMNSAALVRLHKTFGTGAFMRLSRDELLSAKASQLSTKVFDAARNQVQNTNRLRQLAKRLAAETERRAQIQLMGELLDAKSHAVSPLMLELVAAPDMKAPSVLRSVLARLGADAVEPLIAWLDSPDLRARKEAIIVLAKIGRRSAVPFLLGPMLTPQDEMELRLASTAIERIDGQVPSRVDSIAHIWQQADRYYQGVIASQSNEQNKVEQWIWKSPEVGCISVESTVRDASNLRALRLYRQLAKVSPNDRKIRIRHLITALSVDKSTNGIDTPLDESNSNFHALLSDAENGVGDMETVLSQAVRDRQTMAAIAAAEILGDIGSEKILRSRDGLSSPLAKALTHPNKRLRFAAATSILKFAPKKRFAGAQHWADVFGYFAGSRGRRQALIVHPRAPVAQSFAGLLSQSGIEAQIVTSETEFLKESVSSPDFDLFLISDALNQPPASELVQIVRRDPRTADIPIGLLSRPLTNNKTRFTADLNDQVTSVTELVDLVPLLRNVNAVIGTSSVHHRSESKRHEMASQSLDGLRYIVDSDNMGIDVTRHVDPIISAMNGGSTTAAAILGRIGSSDAQVALVRFANNELRSSEQREVAAASFQSSVKRYGLLLEKAEILTQLKRSTDDLSNSDSANVAGLIVEVIKSKITR